MSNDIAISVIIPLYNVEMYLHQCLDSIINQTLKDIEIICVNDGSTDDTLNILNEYQLKDPRIKVITRKNGGCGVARNTGMEIATGEFVIFPDGDDFYKLNMLERMYNRAKEDNSDIVRTGYYLYDDSTMKKITATLLAYDGKTQDSVISLKNEPLKLFKIGPPVACNKLIKREIFVKNNILFDSCKYRTDFSGFHTAMAVANKISIMNEAFAYYRASRVNNLTYNRFREIDNFLFDFYVMEKLKNNLIRLNLFKLYEKAFMCKCMALSKKIVDDRKKSLVRLVVSDYIYNIICKYKNENN